MDRVYLDWAATSPPSADVLDQMNDAAVNFSGNPSSLHQEGKKAATLLKRDREKCAGLLETAEERIFFTSGGTESNAIVMNSLLLARSPGNILLSGIEHPSLYEYLPFLKRYGYSITLLKPDTSGIIHPDTVASKLRQETSMVVIMTVNNETGAVQPLEEIVRTIRNFEKLNGRHIHIHTDAVQALGKIPFYPEKLDVDSASFSAHKIEGPRGIGMLYAKKIPGAISAGGGQERGIRPGTENIAGIHGLTRALENHLTNLEERNKHAHMLLHLLITQYKNIPEIEILDRTPEHSPFIINASIKHFPGEVFTRIMDDRGFAISTGSACSSRNKTKKTRVLSASGISENRAFHSFRVSTGFSTTEEDIYRFCRAIEQEIIPFRRK